MHKISIRSQFQDPRFLHYKNCMGNTAPEKLFGPHYSSTKYEQLIYNPNRLIEKTFPIGIFTPTSVEDVQTAIKCGVRNDIHLVPISGGHSYAGLSFGSNDSVLIDFRYMNDISVDESEMVATIGAGTLLGHVYHTLFYKYGLGAPLGVCPTVAMAGLVLGGGIGLLSTHYGLIIDNIVEMNMVDASGNAVRIDATHNEDLWWAMRGIGPGYVGLVTSFKVKVFRADTTQFDYVKIRMRNRNFATFMGNYYRWLDWVDRNDPKINSIVTIRKGQLIPFTRF